MKDDLRYWLAFTKLKGIQRSVLRAALAGFGSPRAIFQAKEADFQAINHIDPGGKLKKAVSSFAGFSDVDNDLERLAALDGEVITLDDERYPSLLNETHDPPFLLYLKGNPGLLKLPAFAIVGTRVTTEYGRRMAEEISAGLAVTGISVVSGMARGCDTAAHKGALKVGGATIAVLGTGLDVIYPPENKHLYNELASKGLLVSEFPLGFTPTQWSFPVRNRIISGLSLGVLVAEAPLKSGAMTTASLALDAGREVFSIPGQVSSKKSAGTNKLLKDGAHLVEDASDILGVLSLSPALAGVIKTAVKENNKEGVSLRLERDFPEKTELVSLIMDLLDGGALHIDEVAKGAGLAIAVTSALLMEMELKGYVDQAPGKSFTIRPL